MTRARIHWLPAQVAYSNMALSNRVLTTTIYHVRGFRAERERGAETKVQKSFRTSDIKRLRGCSDKRTAADFLCVVQVETRCADRSDNDRTSHRRGQGDQAAGSTLQGAAPL
jgi:hypothetical protein